MIYVSTIPLRFDEGWNMIQFDLVDFTKNIYGTKYVETLKVKVNANCRIRQMYFSDRYYREDELRDDLKYFLPIQVSELLFNFVFFISKNS